MLRRRSTSKNHLAAGLVLATEEERMVSDYPQAEAKARYQFPKLLAAGGA